MVHEDAVNALFVAVKEADHCGGLAKVNLGLEISIPGIKVLIIPWSNRHDAVPGLGKCARQTVADRTKAASYGPRRDLRTHEHNVHGTLLA